MRRSRALAGFVGLAGLLGVLGATALAGDNGDERLPLAARDSRLLDSDHLAASAQEAMRQLERCLARPGSSDSECSAKFEDAERAVSALSTRNQRIIDSAPKPSDELTGALQDWGTCMMDRGHTAYSDPSAAYLAADELESTRTVLQDLPAVPPTTTLAPHHGAGQPDGGPGGSFTSAPTTTNAAAAVADETRIDTSADKSVTNGGPTDLPTTTLHFVEDASQVVIVRPAQAEDELNAQTIRDDSDACDREVGLAEVVHRETARVLAELEED